MQEQRPERLWGTETDGETGLQGLGLRPLHQEEKGREEKLQVQVASRGASAGTCVVHDLKAWEGSGVENYVTR